MHFHESDSESESESKFRNGSCTFTSLKVNFATDQASFAKFLFANNFYLPSLKVRNNCHMLLDFDRFGETSKFRCRLKQFGWLVAVLASA